MGLQSAYCLLDERAMCHIYFMTEERETIYSANIQQQKLWWHYVLGRVMYKQTFYVDAEL